MHRVCLSSDLSYGMWLGGGADRISVVGSEREVVELRARYTAESAERKLLYNKLLELKGGNQLYRLPPVFRTSMFHLDHLEES